MDLKNTLTFGGVNSATYGIYIDGSGVFNSPERDVTMVTIPNRNGQLVLDNGRFENIEVTYNAFVTENNGKTMAENIRDFRNAIGSLKGYQRLEDTYHTDEFRMAVFRNGIEVEPVIYQTGGAFEITFNCKPQRFLTSGETAVSVANNGTITNPTKFDAEPLLEFKGYGNIGIDGGTITVHNDPVGLITLYNAFTSNNIIYSLDSNKYVTGDAITIVSGTKVKFMLTGAAGVTVNSFAYNAVNATVSDSGYFYTNGAQTGIWVEITLDSIDYVAGTTATKTFGADITSINYTRNNVTQTVTATTRAYFEYDGATDQITIYGTCSTLNDFAFAILVNNKETTVFSTKGMLNNVIYIDLDIAEAYAYENGSLINLNNIVTIPNIPPVLPSGSNTITYDNTITNFKIAPRWWRI